MNRKSVAIILILTLGSMLTMTGVLFAKDKGKLYLMSERQTLTKRAGIPCPEGEEDFCFMNSRCKDGQIARGIVLNMEDIAGKSVPTGFGLECSNPNELYKKEEVGATGKEFSGKVYRDSCDAGFYLAGAKFYTNDRETISGVQSVCRRYWPIEERESINKFGNGFQELPVLCPSGKFVSGQKLSFWRGLDGQDIKTNLYSVRFYCSEMREYRGKPKKEKDPREPRKHGM